MQLALLLSVALSANGPDTAKIVISGPKQVTDGWVRTNDVSSFKGPVLEAHGRAWSAYDTVLVRFNLKSVRPERFARLKKATLRMVALTAANAKKMPTVVAPSNIAWTTKAKFSSPIGKQKVHTWPSRAAHPNINYAMIDGLASKRVVTKPGVVDFDVTKIVERWLYQGLPNRGVLITTSQPIFGMPDAGTWTLTFASSEAKPKRAPKSSKKFAKIAGPTLILEMAGAPPSPEAADKRALALYPSASLAPIRDPYYFVYYSVGKKKQWERLRTINVTTYSSHSLWLQPRGVMNLAWAEGGPVGWLPNKDSYKTYYTHTAKAYPVGFCGHESNLGDKMNWLADAFKAAKSKHPDRLAAYYYRGEGVMAKAAAAGHIDLLIQEGYTSVHKQFPIKGFAIGMTGIKRRIDIARKNGAIHKQIVMLGHICKPDQYHKGYELTPKRVDQMIAELRKYAPEMPGIGFYGVGADPKRTVMCDRLVHKHFVAVAPDVELVHPIFGQELSTPHVTLSASAKARDKRKVVRYRWFVDNRLVSETSQADWTWDLRGEKAGTHVVSVHAIDDLWNRSASQVSVRVTNHRGGGVTAASR